MIPDTSGFVSSRRLPRARPAVIAAAARALILAQLAALLPERAGCAAPRIDTRYAAPGSIEIIELRP